MAAGKAAKVNCNSSTVLVTGCILGSRATLYTVATAGGAVQVGYGAAGIAAGVGWLQ